jgi:hypothetical protein
MMKAWKWIVISLLAAVGVQAGVVWDDSFDGASLNANLSVSASAVGSVTQTGGQLQMFLSGNDAFQRAKVVTSSGQNGEMQHYNGADLYDFTDHQVSVRFEIASFLGTPADISNFNAFHVGIGELNASAGVATGVKIDLAKRNNAGSDLWRLELDGFGALIQLVLDGMPTAFEFDLEGTNLTLRVEGTTFTSGLDTYSWTFNSGTAASYELMFGAYNKGTPTVGTQVTLDSFEVTTVPYSYTISVCPSPQSRLTVVNDLFESPGVDQWPTVMSQINSFTWFGTVTDPKNASLSNYIDPAGMSAWANQENVEIGTEGGSIRPTVGWGDTVNGADYPAYDSVRETLKHLDPIFENGGEVSFMRLDGPISRLIMDTSTGLALKNDLPGGLTLSESVSRLVEFWQGIHARYPNIKIGVIPNYLVWNWDDDGTILHAPAPTVAPNATDKSGHTMNEVLDALYTALDAVGEEIAFICPETAWHWYGVTQDKDGNPVDNDLRFQKLKAWCDARNIKVTVMANGWDNSAAPAEAAQYFYDSTMAYITRMHDIGIYPDDWVIESWWEDPELNVPESTAYTFMNTVRDAIAHIHSTYNGEYGMGGTGHATNAAVPAAGQVSAPAPADAAVEQAVTTTLAWTEGSGTVRADVFFGTNSNPGASEYQGWFSNRTTFDPGILQPNTTYYWRVDSLNTSGTTTGPVWSFSTSTAENLEVLELEFVDDTDVRDALGTEDSSYSTREVMRALNSGHPASPNSMEAYVKVLIPSAGVQFPIQSARLRLHAIDPVVLDEVSIYPVADASWTGSSLTWNTKPARGALIASEESDTGTGWFEFDITAQITGPGYYAFVLDTEVTDVISMATINNTDSSLWPKLLIEHTAPPSRMVWDESFDGASLNTNLSVKATSAGSVTQTGGQLQMFLSGNDAFQRAKVVTSSGQNGETQHYNGADLYDFTDHQVSVRFGKRCQCMHLCRVNYSSLPRPFL